MKNKILFVEDQEDLGNVTRQYLQIMDFEVEWVTNAEAALQSYQQYSSVFDLLVIDIQLPGMNGFELAEKIKKSDSSVPFLFLTARNEKKERMRGLKIGAADYISKPFDIDELILRMRNIISRHKTSIKSQQELSNGLSVGDIILLKDVLQLNIANYAPVSLTLRETELLEYLFQNCNRVIKREEILLNLWGENDYFLGRSLDVFISRLRKILTPSKKVSINNVYGIGFIFIVNKQ